jgi:hypothetical protein
MGRTYLIAWKAGNDCLFFGLEAQTCLHRTPYSRTTYSWGLRLGLGIQARSTY